ncbi:HlyD family secretion protein [Marilutibacter alkalisoli]|uniref:Biotin/lipoyl-binding protein n=1 Tax=Marilutibacter alkalisoli TaxID=2591633 RepID=A0A514BPF3_9GAMM|nr:efflux RND transporter periplasmic adaptor subunit [Lysobacter alkalisoli]QDH69258.1 biotin/lipoyl-binding protein [Lysobacter alkalisoli]
MNDDLQRDASTPVAAGPGARARRWWPLLVVMVLGFGIWLAFRAPPDRVQAMADADSVKVAAKITARVARLLVREGDRVEAGQVLFELDSPEVAAKLEQAEAMLAAARAQAEKAEEGARSEEIRAAEANWKRAAAGRDFAHATWRRLENLHAEGVVSRQRRDEALAQARSAEEQQAAARAQYDQALAGARSQDRDAAQAQVRQAEAAVAEVQAARAEVAGHAPVAGEIGTRLVDVGELVPAGYPVFTLVDLDAMWVAMYLREDQFGGASVGKRINGHIPALEREDVEFEIYYIAPAGDFATWRATRQSSGYDVKSFEVRARPVERIEGFRPGMSVLFRWPQR